MNKHFLISLTVFFSLLATARTAHAISSDSVVYTPQAGAFCISDKGKAASLYIDEQDWPGVHIAARNLAADIGRVTGTATVLEEERPAGQGMLIAGTLGHSRWIDSLVAEGRIDISPIKGCWESYIIEVSDGNLVVAGSDKRGTIFGLYDLAEKIGVSPWYYMADVPVQQHAALYVMPGRYVQESPKVKYRGIFLNDEWPSLGGWASAKFGGFKKGFHEHVFELLLRLRANYLKPLPPRERKLKLVTGVGRMRSEVFDNLRWLTTEIEVDKPGLHTFKVYMVDPEIVLEQLVFSPDNAHPSYFGAQPLQHQCGRCGKPEAEKM